MKPKYVALAALALSACSVTAQVLYQENFNSLADSSGSAVNLGGYGVLDNPGALAGRFKAGRTAGRGGVIHLTAGINGNGVGSQALFGT